MKPEILKTRILSLIIIILAGCLSFLVIRIQAQNKNNYYEFTGTPILGRSCILSLGYTNHLNKEFKNYCFNLTDENGKIKSYNEKDLEIMNCILNYAPCKYEKKEEKENK